MIYFFLLIYILGLAFFYDFGNLRIGSNLNKVIIFILLVSLAGLRYRIGGDTYYYMIWYEVLPDLNELFNTNLGISKFQPLWIILNAISKSISKEFFVFQILHALIINFALFHFFHKHTRYFFTAIFFYYIGFYGYFNFEILRESLSVVVFLLAIDPFLKKSWIRYYTYCIIAFGFHYSAIILFFLPVLTKIPINLYALTLIIAIGFFLNKVFMHYISSIIPDSGITYSLSTYKDYTYTIFGFLSIILLFVLYPKLIWYLSARFAANTIELSVFIRLYILIGAFSTLFFIFFRFLNYFTPFLILFISNIIHGIFRDKRLGIFKPSLVIISLMFFTFIHTNRYFTDTSDHVKNTRWYSRWYPYYSVFSKKTDPVREELFLNL